MKRTYQSNFLVFLALLKRSTKTYRQQLPHTVLDGIILTSLNVLVFGYLFPAMSMPESLIAPVFLGTLITLSCNLGFSMATRVVRDLRFTRFIDYLLTLPFDKNWLWGYYVTSFVIELAISTVPLLIFGLWALSNKIDLSNAQWHYFVIIYLLGNLFFSLLFLSLSFLYPYFWFIDNIWPRRLTPLIISGSVYAPWQRIYELSNTLGILFLVNPITYLAEGMRSSLLGSTHYINPLFCIAALVIAVGFSTVLLSFSTKKLTEV